MSGARGHCGNRCAQCRLCAAESSWAEGVNHPFVDGHALLACPVRYGRHPPTTGQADGRVAFGAGTSASVSTQPAMAWVIEDGGHGGPPGFAPAASRKGAAMLGTPQQLAKLEETWRGQRPETGPVADDPPPPGRPRRGCRHPGVHGGSSRDLLGVVDRHQPAVRDPVPGKVAGHPLAPEPPRRRV